MALVLTNAGRAVIVQRLIGAGTNPAYVGWGTGAGTAAATDTVLFTAAPEARTLGTATCQQQNVANDTLQVVGSVVAGAAETIREVGLFDAATVGNLCVHSDFPAITLQTGDQIQFTVRLTWT